MLFTATATFFFATATFFFATATFFFATATFFFVAFFISERRNYDIIIRYINIEGQENFTTISCIDIKITGKICLVIES